MFVWLEPVVGLDCRFWQLPSKCLGDATRDTVFVNVKVGDGAEASSPRSSSSFAVRPSPPHEDFAISKALSAATSPSLTTAPLL